MSDAERSEITVKAVRANWPILMVVVAGIVTWTEARMTVATLDEKMRHFEKLLSRDQFTEFAKWQEAQNWINRAQDEKLARMEKSCGN